MLPRLIVVPWALVSAPWRQAFSDFRNRLVVKIKLHLRIVSENHLVNFRILPPLKRLD